MFYVDQSHTNTMSGSSHKNISVRFCCKNDQEQLQETEEADSDDENFFDASFAGPTSTSSSSLHLPLTTSSSASSTTNRSSAPKWLNDSWKKFTQIVEEHKEKAAKKGTGPIYRELDNIVCDDTNDTVRVETGHTSDLLSDSIMDDEDVFLGEEICELSGYHRPDDSPIEHLIKPTKFTLNALPLDIPNVQITAPVRPRHSSSHDRSPPGESSTIPIKSDQKRFSLFSRFRYDNNVHDKSHLSASSESLHSKTSPTPPPPITITDTDIGNVSPTNSPTCDKASSKTAKLFFNDSSSSSTSSFPRFSSNSLHTSTATSSLRPDADDSKELLNQKPNTESDPIIAYLLNPFVYWCRNRFSLKFFLSISVTVFLAIGFFQLSPFSGFANGFLLGWAFAIFNCVILFTYVLSKIFQKLDTENQRHCKVLSGQKWKSMPAFSSIPSTKDQCFEGWFYELVYSKKFGIGRSGPEVGEKSELSDTKARLIYLRLENTLLRVFTPIGDQLKKPPLSGDRIHFYKHSSKMNLRIYDFSLMKNARISLWLPKNIRNRQKYMWMLKYPLILTLHETNRLIEMEERKPIKMILFARTNRDKEEWHARFRSVIESCEHLTNARSSTTQSTPEERPKSAEHMSRTMSLDIGEWNRDEFKHLTSLLSFDTFMQEILGDSISTANDSFTSNSSAVNPSIPKRLLTNNLLWFNALVGRIMFDFLTHPHWTRWVHFKIQRKLTRIKLPYFIQTLSLKAVNLGHSVPKFLSVSSEPVLNEKGLWIDMELNYQGGFTMTLETKLDLMRLKDSKASERELKPMNNSPSFGSLNASAALDDCDEFSDPESIVDLSDDDSEESWSIENDSRQGKLIKYLDKFASSNFFQHATENKFVKRKMEEVSNMPLLLTVTLQELHGVLTVNLPRPSSDRLWYGFRENPTLVLDAQPAFGEWVVSLTHISQWIAKKLKQEFNKLLVVPNMDDIVIQPMMSSDTFIDETLL